MAEKVKVRLRVGDAELLAEGPEELVQRQVDRFLAAFGTKASPDASSERPPPLPATVPAAGTLNARARFTAHAYVRPEPPIGAPRLTEIFDITDGIVSLKNRLPSPTNSLLVLLWGIAFYTGQRTVSGRLLLISSAHSKNMLLLGRVDRALDAIPELVATEGSGRGRRYSLTPEGMTYVEQLLVRWDEEIKKGEAGE